LPKGSPKSCEDVTKNIALPIKNLQRRSSGRRSGSAGKLSGGLFWIGADAGCWPNGLCESSMEKAEHR
jgi:hypothetical protein